MINEGKVKRGGVNKYPTTPPPAAPKGQGGSLTKGEMMKQGNKLQSLITRFRALGVTLPTKKERGTK